MERTSPRWRQVTPSQHAWEADALEALCALLPDADPVQAWANFEFTDGGRIFEADALAVTAKGVFLIEIKSWKGTVTGDQSRWLQRRNDGTERSHSSPINTTALKARILASMLKRHWRDDRLEVPLIEPLVWMSDLDVTLRLPPELRNHVVVADGDDHNSGYSSISDRLLRVAKAHRAQQRITAAQADRFAATMERLGLKEGLHVRTAGSYELTIPAFAERGATQDFMAKHGLTGEPARVRVFSNVFDMSAEHATMLKDAAEREYHTTRNLPSDGVVAVKDFALTDFGPAVIFEHDPKAIRLDAFVAEHGDSLDLAQSIALVEQVAGIMRNAHQRGIAHRMLTPESIWLKPARPADVDATGLAWTASISDWSMAAREGDRIGTTVATYTRVGKLPMAAAGALEVVLGDPAAETYSAPEAFTDPDPLGVTLDVFSLGAIAFLLCTGLPPAENRAALRQMLDVNRGLSLASALGDVDPFVDDLVRKATNPVVSDRHQSMSELLAEFALAQARLSGAADDTVANPQDAQEGSVLADRFEVKRRLGKGSTAIALWCRDRTHDRDVVLKVSLGGSADDRIRAEADVLGDLKHQNVVELFELIELGDRPTLVLSFAGERSLAHYLSDEGATAAEYLRRWGDDLLEALRYLERVGVSHRDVKPDNLGVVQAGPHKHLHLVLFDFSLAGTSSDDTSTGTPPYLEPFLADDGRDGYDLAAERYAAAVTLHEIATGETPVWGDGRSDPSFLPADTEATLLVEAIDPEVAPQVGAFLAKALRRDPSQRFDTADDMVRAWTDAFAQWDASSAESESAPDDESPDATAARAVKLALPDTASLDDPIATLEVAAKVRSALRKLGASTLREVARLEPKAVMTAAGIGRKNRKVILQARGALLERFADDLAAELSAPVEPAAAEPTTAAPTEAAEADEAPAAVESVQRLDLGQLALRLVPPRGQRGRAGTRNEQIRMILGLDPMPTDAPARDWPTAQDVAEAHDVTRGAVAIAQMKTREFWAASPELMSVGYDLLDVLAELGGVGGVSELTDPLVERRGVGADDDTDSRTLAAAVVRAVCEADHPLGRCFALRRHGRRTLVAIDGAAVTNATADSSLAAQLADATNHTNLAGFDADALLDAAVALGRRADELVADGNPVPSSDVVPALRAVRRDVSSSFSDARLVRLAVAASDDAATNVASDLFRVAIAPEDALRWCRSTLIAHDRLSLVELADRVGARFPGVVLPPRPALDTAVAAANLPFDWSASDDAYLRHGQQPGGLSNFTLPQQRKSTRHTTGGRTVPPAVRESPEAIAAGEVDERLERSRRNGGFVAIRVPTDRAVHARRNLARYADGDAAFTTVDLEATFLSHLRSLAESKRIVWSRIEDADDPANASDWARLSQVAADAVSATIADVTALERVIAWYPGVLVRHGELVRPAPLDQLRAAVYDGDSALSTLWLVVLGGTSEARPTVDGTPVPVQASHEWLDANDAWLSNIRRGAVDEGVGA